LEKFDFIICGTGCSGLLMAHALNRSSILSGKRVLLIDNRVNPCQDNTFGFWYRGENEFDSIVVNNWNKLMIANQSISIPIKLQEYRYNMINGSVLFQSIIKKLSNNPNIVFDRATVNSIYEYNEEAIVETENNKYPGNFIFNSTPPDYTKISLHPEYLTLWQHFNGWEITTENVSFDTDTATFMDFRIEQGPNMRFAYVLPVSGNRALIEIIAFDIHPGDTLSFDELLKNYISQTLKIDCYTINYTESGMIPMTEYPFKRREDQHIFNIGLRGGMVSMATGYGFTRIQKEINQMVSNLEKYGNPIVIKSIWRKRFRLYDNTLLDVLSKNRLKGNILFADFFRKNNPERILRFLDEETNLIEELVIFSKVNISIFLKATASTLIRALRRKLRAILKFNKQKSSNLRSTKQEISNIYKRPTVKAV
jgi:lycopene beta-cyclase